MPKSSGQANANMEEKRKPSFNLSISIKVVFFFIAAQHSSLDINKPAFTL